MAGETSISAGTWEAALATIKLNKKAKIN